MGDRLFERVKGPPLGGFTEAITKHRRRDGVLVRAMTHPCLLTDSCFSGLKHVGYWKPTERAIEQQARLATVIQGFEFSAQWKAALALPWPGDFVVTEPWDGREGVIRHLKAGRVNYSYDGWSECRLCGQANGSRDLTDGAWGWPEGFAHYVEDHGVKPSQEFIDHVLRFRKAAE